VLLVAGGVAVAVNAAGTNQAGSGTDPTATPGATGSPSTGASAPVVPADEQCTDAIKSNTRWVCLTRATFDGQKITIEYEANFAGASPNVNGGFHLHIYGGDGTDPPASVMGAQAKGNAGNWYVEDDNPSVRSASSNDFKEAIGADAQKVCARIADRRHNLVPDKSGGFATGNCVPITRS
jgi:molecular chaperone DnaK